MVKMVIVSTLSAFQSTRVQFMREKKSDATPQKNTAWNNFGAIFEPTTFEVQYFW